MKKLLLVCITALTFASPACADSLGFRIGTPSGVQYTFDDAIGRGKDLRIAVQFNAFFDDSYFQVQADGILGRPTLGDNRDLSWFYGLGAHLRSSTVGTLALGGQGTIGVEYQINRQLSAFFDGSIGASLGSGQRSGIYSYGSGALGINIKL